MNRYFRAQPINRKLLVLLMGTAGVSLLVSSLIDAAIDIRRLRGDLTNNLQAVAKLVGTASSTAVVFEDPEAAQESLDALAVEQRILGAYLYDDEGRQFAQFVRAGGGLGKELAAADAQALGFSAGSLHIRQPLYLGAREIGSIYLIGDAEAITQGVIQKLSLTLLALAVALAVAFVISLALQRTISQPILALAETARRVSSEQDYSLRQETDLEDEVGVMIRGFNDMLAQIEYRDAQLQRARDELEDRVEERTRELLEEIREREELQEQLARSAKMKSLGLLAGGVAHDLNNILGPLVAYPDLILADLPGDSPLRRALVAMQKSASRAAAIVQDLLTLARRGNFDPEPLWLQEVLADYLDSASFAEKRALFPKVRIETHIEEDARPIKGSPAHLSQVVMNLIINAMEATRERGKLDLRIANRRLEEPLAGYEKIEPGDYVLLEVRDDGAGISEESLEKIFEPFYSRKEMGPSGSGLGLSVVYGVVKDHEGFIDLRTEVGKGTSFTLLFPASQEVPIAVSPTVAEGDYRGTERVLVVDDMPEQQELAEQVLTALGYTVSTVGGGREALSELARRTFDVVLIDMIMDEDFDGLDTFKAIRKRHPRQVCVIVSGYAENERLREALDSGAATHVKKPYSPVRIGSAIRESLEPADAPTPGRSRRRLPTGRPSLIDG